MLYTAASAARQQRVTTLSAEASMHLRSTPVNACVAKIHKANCHQQQGGYAAGESHCMLVGTGMSRHWTDRL